MKTEPLKAPHVCDRCGGKFRAVIQAELRVVHRAYCPHCGAAQYFDNRDGELLRLARAAASAAPPMPALRRQEEPRRSLPGAARDASPSVGRRNAQAITRRPRSKAQGSITGLWQELQRLSNSFLHLAAGRSRHGSRGPLLLVAAAAALVLSVALLLAASLHLPRLYFPGGADAYTARLRFIQPNTIVDRNGQPIAELFAERTGALQPDQLPPSLKSVLLFVEDDQFYQHGAVRWSSVFRAAAANLLSFGYSQGGSTITQQLARILLGSREKSLLRKLRETALAYYLEDSLSKDEILAAYMNLVYLGHGARGFEVASSFYFNRQIGELSFAEQLALASLPSAPERFSPLRNPRQLRGKMDRIYLRMRDEGFPVPELIDYQRQSDLALRTVTRRPADSVFGVRLNDAPYVAEHVRQLLAELFGEDYQFGAGLRIETTIDRQLQIAAARETKQFIGEVAPNFPPARYVDGKRVPIEDERLRFVQDYSNFAIAGELFGMPTPANVRPRLQSASAGVDPASGGVLFLQGGADFTPGNQLNRAVQMRRQTGSAIKPVVYSAAIESGALTAASILEDSPIFVSGGNTDRYWLPHNFSGVYEGPIPVRRALARSQNIPAIQAARAIGIDRLGEQFQKFFFPSEPRFAARFRPDETAAIGSIEMSPLEMAVAFSAFAANGIIHRPYLVKRILDGSGKLLYQAGARDEFHFDAPTERKAVDGATAEVMVSLMSDSARFGGVSRGASLSNLFGKTGTSNDFRDAWFAGAIPGAAAAVWVGYDAPLYSMANGTGAALAGPLFGRILNAAPRQSGGYYFEPRAVRRTVCEETGRQPGASCHKRVQEWFTPLHGPPPPAEEDLRPPQTNDWSLNRDSDFH
ncbi:MAG: transglycosylase domain-containing protein [Leptospirales bacterium]|nr:transglycosylase domain-containing protein [Leptospirales bacterium]